MKTRTKRLLIILFILFSFYYVLTHLVYKGVNTDQINSNQTIKIENKSYSFRSSKLLEEHFEKHGKEMGFKTKEEYVLAATNLINNPKSLHKLEIEDGDDLYYLEETNEYVVVSRDGYIRTYFKPERGKTYFDSK